MDKGDFKGAVDDYNHAIRLDPNNPDSYTRRGEAWRLQGDLKSSLADHNKAIDLNPNEVAYYNNRALTLKDQGKLDEAIADCGEAIMMDPQSYFAYANRGLIRRLKGDLWASLTDLNKAVELTPRSPIALTFRGDTLRGLGNINGAWEDFNKALQILPDFVAAFTGRSLTYEKMAIGRRPKWILKKPWAFRPTSMPGSPGQLRTWRGRGWPRSRQKKLRVPKQRLKAHQKSRPERSPTTSAGFGSPRACTADWRVRLFERLASTAECQERSARPQGGAGAAV